MFKDLCKSRLSRSLKDSAAWRTSQANNFSDDSRNVDAAKRLLELESQIVIPDVVWQKLSPYFSEQGTKWLAAVSKTNRDVGFRKHPADFEAYLQNLVANLH